MRSIGVGVAVVVCNGVCNALVINLIDKTCVGEVLLSIQLYRAYLRYKRLRRITYVLTIHCIRINASGVLHASDVRQKFCQCM